MKDVVVKFFLTKEDADRLKAYLKPMGGKAGPFAKALVLRELAKAEPCPK